MAIGLDGVVWFGTDFGVVRYKNDMVTTYTTQDGLPSNHVCAIAVDSKGTVWAGDCFDNHGLFRYKDGTWSVFGKDDGLPDNNILSVASDSSGNIWACSPYYVSCYNWLTWTNYSNGEYFDDYYITILRIAPDGNIWVGTTGNLYRYDGNTWTSYNGWTSNIVVDSRKGFFIRAIGFDNEGNVWAGTNLYGLFKFDGNEWTHYTTENGLPHIAITAIDTGPQGDVWVGTLDGLAHYNQGTWKTYPRGDDWLNNGINAFAVAQNGTVWVAASGRISRLEGDTWISFFDNDVDENVRHNAITSIAVDNNGIVWIGGVTLIRFDGETFTQFVDSETKLAFPVTSIAVCPEYILFGSSLGIFQYGAKHSIFKKVAEIDNTDTSEVENSSSLPREITLAGNYPNPFNMKTTITFYLHQTSFINLSIYSISGQNICTLISDVIPSGTNSVKWDGTDYSGQPVSSGVYLAVIKAESHIATHRMLLLR